MDSKFPGKIDPGVYTDLASLSKLKAKAGEDGDAALREVAQQFEQVFMNMMLKSMREANEAFAQDDPFNSSEVQFYQGMLDQQLTLELAGSKGLGLADIIVRQLGGSNLSPETLKQAMQLPTEEVSSIDSRLGQGQTLNEVLMNIASRRVAGHSLNAVDQISERLGEQSAQREQTETGQVAPSAEVEAPVASTGVSASEAIFETPEQFVEQMLPLAEKAAQQLGIEPRVLVAQAALETGWGRSIIRDGQGNSSNNLFNIKADGRWKGDRMAVQTLEYRDGLPRPERAEFRAYDSLDQSLEDYVGFIRNNPRYESALKAADDPVAYLQALQHAGYATDPEYAEKIERIFSGTTLAAVGRNAQEG